MPDMAREWKCQMAVDLIAPAYRSSRNLGWIYAGRNGPVGDRRNGRRLE
jgi:hypothetical protein